MISFRKILFIISFFLVFLFSCFFSPTVFAAKTIKDAPTALGQVMAPTGFDTSETAVEKLGSIIKVGLSLVGIIFFILMFYAGFKWMNARGAEETIKTSQNTIIAAVIGLVIVLVAYAVASYVTGKIGI